MPETEEDVQPDELVGVDADESEEVVIDFKRPLRDAEDEVED